MKKHFSIHKVILPVLAFVTLTAIPVAAEAKDVEMIVDRETKVYSHDGTALVTYGTVGKADKAVLDTIFDAEWYAEAYPDVVECYGTTDPEVLFKHYITYGIFECRQPNANFNVDAYLTAYDDIYEAFGEDYVKTTVHYATFGISENREITTIEDCISNGLNVYHYNGAESAEDVLVAEVPKHVDAETNESESTIPVYIYSGVSRFISSVSSDATYLQGQTWGELLSQKEIVICAELPGQGTYNLSVGISSDIDGITDAVGLFIDNGFCGVLYNCESDANDNSAIVRENDLIDNSYVMLIIGG